MSTRSAPAPTLTGALLFALKATLLRVRRALRDSFSRTSLRAMRGDALANAPLLAEVRQPLRTNDVPGERWLQNGKIQNLRIAAAAIDGCELDAGMTFSFWREVGRPVRRRGFVKGRELREGCIVASIGGGLCQLSNALYQAAVDAGLEIVERHAHSITLPSSAAAAGRDATVFWNYVDLRLRAPYRVRIEATLSESELLIRIRASSAAVRSSTRAAAIVISESAQTANDCATCGVEECFRHDATRAESVGRTAYLVDDFWPEFDRYISEQASSDDETNDDELLLPIDGARFGLGSYRWMTKRFARVVQQPRLVAIRSLRSRRLAQQGAARQRTLLETDARLAEAFGRALSPDVEHVVVALSLLPFLHRSGALGGRSVDVLANRLPLSLIHASLDRARQIHPDSTTLGDFRADSRLLADEDALLASCRRFITPHRHLAAHFGDRAILLDWQLPSRRTLPVHGRKSRIVFPASTLARKGAIELRDAIRGLDVALAVTGPSLEAPDFWRDTTATRIDANDDWLAGATAVVLPSFVESQPRRLLAALAAGVPVIATEECGVAGMPGVTSIPSGDGAALRDAIRAICCEPIAGG